MVGARSRSGQRGRARGLAGNPAGRRAWLAVTGLAAVAALVAALGLPPWMPAAALAVAPLGPVAAWHCLAAAGYAYDPRYETADGVLLAERPEAAAAAALRAGHAWAVEVERVEVSPATGEAVVRATLYPDARPPQGRVLVLAPGRVRQVTAAAPDGVRRLCSRDLAAWEVVADHATGDA